LSEIEIKTLKEVRKTPLDLAEGFEWYEINVDSKEELNEIFELLKGNYVEDDESMFRFAYPVEFLQWYTFY
jgi:glycylpeptide N-tetradecanoyltransferase